MSRSHGPLAESRVIAKIPARDLDRARAFYRDQLGLEPVEERPGGLRFCCGEGEFHVFSSGFWVGEGIVDVDGNYPSKGTGERGAFFRDSEGNVIGLGQAIGG